MSSFGGIIARIRLGHDANLIRQRPPMSMLPSPSSTRKRLTAEEEMLLSTRIRAIESHVEKLLMGIPSCVQILSQRTKRKELTSSRHVDRLNEAVKVVKLLRPRPPAALEVMGLWKEAETKRWELAMSGYRIAVGEARKMASRGLEHEDLVNEGIVGLLDAAKRFDPSRKLRFSTYARWWVRARMLRAIDTTGTTVRLPGGLLERLRRLEMLKAQMEKMGGSWNIESLAEAIGLSVDEVRDVLHINEETQVVPISMGPPTSDSESRSLEDVLACDKIASPERICELSRMNEALIGAVNKLQPRHRHVVSLYLGLDPSSDSRTWTLQTAADQIGISRERVRQLLLWVRSRVAEELAEPEELVQPFSLPDPVSVLAALSSSGSMSSSGLAKRVYGQAIRKPHVEAIEEILAVFEREGRVFSEARERRTLWKVVASS